MRSTALPGWYIEFQAALLRQAPRPGDIDQQIAEGWTSNQKSLKESLATCLLPPPVDDRFKLINSFPVVVPEGYDHATRLDSFAREHRPEFSYYNGNITDKNFAKATKQLVPGRKFQVKVFQITQRVSSEDCLAHLRKEQAILVGAQGATLAYEQGKDQLPVSRSISFDEKDALWFDGDYHRVPHVRRSSDGDFKFDLGSFEDDWLDVNCLLSFCDLPADEQPLGT